MKYEFISNRYASYGKLKRSAQEVGEWLGKLDDKTTEGIRRAGLKKSSPIYDYLEKDPLVALKQWQLKQVGNLVLSLGLKTESGPMRAFESVVISGKRQYSSFDTIIKSQDLSQQVCTATYSEMVYFKEKNLRYQIYQEHKNLFGGVFDEMTKTEENYQRMNNEEKASGRKRVKARDTANKKAGRKRDDHRRQSTAS